MGDTFQFKAGGVDAIQGVFGMDERLRSVARRLYGEAMSEGCAPIGVYNLDPGTRVGHIDIGRYRWISQRAIGFQAGRL